MNESTAEYLRSHVCGGEYSIEIPCGLKPGHDGEHGPSPWKMPTMTDARAEHPFAVHLRTDVCGMCGEPAAHKVEETSGPRNIHALTNYLCCTHAGQVLGSAHDGYPYGQDFSSWMDGLGNDSDNQESSNG